MKSFRSVAILAALGSLFPIVRIDAQRVDPLKLIDMHVNAEKQNVSFSGTEREGGKFVLTMKDTHETFAISVVQRAESEFSVTVLRRDIQGNDTTFTSIETLAATLGRPVAITAIPYVTVVVDGTRRASTAASILPQIRPTFVSSANVSSMFGTCCLTCGNVTACACAVRGDCGFCCSDACCPKTLPETMLPRQETQPLSRLGQRPCKPVPESERIYPQFRPASGTMAIRTE